MPMARHAGFLGVGGHAVREGFELEESNGTISCMASSTACLAVMLEVVNRLFVCCCCCFLILFKTFFYGKTKEVIMDFLEK